MKEEDFDEVFKLIVERAEELQVQTHRLFAYEIYQVLYKKFKNSK